MFRLSIQRHSETSNPSRRGSSFLLARSSTSRLLLQRHTLLSGFRDIRDDGKDSYTRHRHQRKSDASASQEWPTPEEVKGLFLRDPEVWSVRIHARSG